ncbi:MAG: DUF4258 domain-containing protein [Methanosarcinales archaeon]
MHRLIINKYNKSDVMTLMRKCLVFTIHAINHKRLESRDLTRIEVEDAIKRGEIIAQYEYPEKERCDEVQIQAYNPTIFVSVGMCENRLVVITTWRGTK